jgi:hypothetical protein
MAHTTDPTVVGDRRARRPAAAAPRWAWPLTLLLSCAGLGVSLYLTWVHYTEPLQLSCPATGIINCVRVTTSSQSEIGGVIPVAVTGIVFFAAMTVLCCPAAWRARSATLHRRTDRAARRLPVVLKCARPDLRPVLLRRRRGHQPDRRRPQPGRRRGRRRGRRSCSRHGAPGDRRGLIRSPDDPCCGPLPSSSRGASRLPGSSARQLSCHWAQAYRSGRRRHPSANSGALRSPGAGGWSTPLGLPSWLHVLRAEQPVSRCGAAQLRAGRGHLRNMQQQQPGPMATTRAWSST